MWQPAVDAIALVCGCGGRRASRRWTPAYIAARLGVTEAEIEKLATLWNKSDRPLQGRLQSIVQDVGGPHDAWRFTWGSIVAGVGRVGTTSPWGTLAGIVVELKDGRKLYYLKPEVGKDAISFARIVVRLALNPKVKAIHPIVGPAGGRESGEYTLFEALKLPHGTKQELLELAFPPVASTIPQPVLQPQPVSPPQPTPQPQPQPAPQPQQPAPTAQQPQETQAVGSTGVSKYLPLVVLGLGGVAAILLLGGGHD